MHDSIFTIDRRKAAELLKVSVRTIDRYIVKNIVSHLRKGARIFLSENEIAKLHLSKFSTSRTHKSKIEKYNTDNQDDSIGIVMSRPRSDIVQASSGGNDFLQGKNRELINQHDDIYKKLYDDALLERRDDQKRLEGANYKVGQLEAKLEFYEKHFIPISEFHREAKMLKNEEINLNTKYFTEKLNLSALEKKLHFEKLNKQVVVGILFVILLLQPILWLVLK